jgi:hypothetical protein
MLIVDMVYRRNSGVQLWMAQFAAEDYGATLRMGYGSSDYPVR